MDLIAHYKSVRYRLNNPPVRFDDLPPPTRFEPAPAPAARTGHRIYVAAVLQPASTMCGCDSLPQRFRPVVRAVLEQNSACWLGLFGPARARGGDSHLKRHAVWRALLDAGMPILRVAQATGFHRTTIIHGLHLPGRRK